MGIGTADARLNKQHDENCQSSHPDPRIADFLKAARHLAVFSKMRFVVQMLDVTLLEIDEESRTSSATMTTESTSNG